MVGSTRIVRQLEQVFEPHRVMFRGLKEKKEAAPHHRGPA
jgi:hypothetical protein